MLEFFSNNSLYSVSLSCTMFIFLSTPFNSWDCYYFGSDLSLVLLIKMLLIKNHVTLFCSLHMSLFLVYCIYVIGTTLPKECCQKWRVCLKKGSQAFCTMWAIHKIKFKTVQMLFQYKFQQPSDKIASNYFHLSHSKANTIVMSRDFVLIIINDAFLEMCILYTEKKINSKSFLKVITNVLSRFDFPFKREFIWYKLHLLL